MIYVVLYSIFRKDLMLQSITLVDLINAMLDLSDEKDTYRGKKCQVKYRGKIVKNSGKITSRVKQKIGEKY